MNLFDAGRVQNAIDDLREIFCSAEALAEMYRGDDGTPDSKFANRAIIAVRKAREVAQSHEFRDAAILANRAECAIGYSHDYATIRSEVTHVADALCDETKKRTFIFIPEARSQYIDNPALFGNEVSEVFPEAADDIREAGNCLGVDCNTAAVFHLMRVVEWGLRNLCFRVGLRKAKKGKGKFVPISHADWETMLNQLQPLVDQKIEKMGRGRAKQTAQEFYYPALQDIRAIRDAWRNHVMHARAIYSYADADAICGHVNRLMSTLARGVDRH